MVDEYRFEMQNQEISVTITERLGRGAFGVVHKVRDEPNGTCYAMKVIPYSDESTKKSAKIEQMALEQMDHDNIVRIYATATRPLSHSVTELCILMEFCEGGTLNSKLAEKTSDEVERKWMLQISDAVGYLHEKNIVHRDLKPENILLTATLNAKVADFGLAKAFMVSDGVSASGGPYMETRAGTSDWMAPEVFKRGYTAKADVFSLGTVIYGIHERTFREVNGKRYYGAFVMGKTHADKPITIALGDAMAHPGDYAGIGNLQFALNGKQSTVSKLILDMLRYEHKTRPSARGVHEVLEMIDLKRTEIQKSVPEDIWDQTLGIIEDVKASKRKFQEITSKVPQQVSIKLSKVVNDEYDIDDDFNSRREDVFKEITNIRYSTLDRSRSLEAKAVGQEGKPTNLASADCKTTLGSSASTRNNDTTREKSAVKRKKTQKKTYISGKDSTFRENRRNRISTEVRDISLDCKRYSSITGNTENENNEQAMNVKNDNKITPFSENVPSGSNVNIPMPDIAVKIEPNYSNEATKKGMCGDEPNLKMEITVSVKDGKRQINTRPTARDGSLPSHRSVMISKSANENPYEAGRDTLLRAKSSGSGAKLPRYGNVGRGRNSVNENGASASFIDLTKSSVAADHAKEIIVISQDSSSPAENPSEEDPTSTFDTNSGDIDTDSDDSVSILP